MNRRRVLAVAGAGLTGGCLRLTGGGTDTPGGESTTTRTATATRTPTPTASPTDSPTLTDSPTPTESPTPTPDPRAFQYPPETGETGLAAPLGRAHSSRLAFDTFSIRRQDGFESLTASVTPDRMLIRPGEYTADVFVASGEYYLRGLVAGERVYDFQQTVPDEFTRDRVVGGTLVSALAEGGQWNVQGVVQRDGEQLLQAVGSDVAAQTPFRDTSRVSRYFRDSFEVTDFAGDCFVTESGVVRRMTASVTAREEETGRSETLQFRVETSDVGETSVSQPGWLSTAEANAPAVSSEFTDNRRAVAVTLEGGSRLPGRGNLDTYDRDGYYDAQLDQPIGVGDTVYVWKRSRDSAAVTREPPSEEPVANWGSNTRFNLRIGRIPLISGRAVGSGPTTRSLLARLLP